MEKSKTMVRRLVESAILIAVGTVLSELKIDMPLGGGLTVCSMLPLVTITGGMGAISAPPRQSCLDIGIFSFLHR